MSTVSYCIDWITSTLKGFGVDYMTRIEQLQIALGEREWLHAQRVPSPYTEGFESDAGVICWSPDYPEFGIMFRSSGINLSVLRKSGVSDRDTVKALLGAGWGFTRLDIAMDLRDTGGRPKEIYDLWKSGKLTTQARQVTIYQQAEGGGKVSGETVYIGSRKSKDGRMIRVYDKAAEQGQSGDWIRVEAELKGKYAQKAAQMIVEMGSLPRVFSSQLFSMVPSGLPDWITGATSGQFELVKIEADTQTNFERWFLSTVLPAIEKSIEQDIPDAEGLIKRAIMSAKARKRGNERSFRGDWNLG